jgi:cell division septum initiation protein DivIVA
MLGSVKYIAILLIIVALGVSFWYISNLQANLAVAKQNEEKLTESIAQQQEVIAQMEADIKAVQEANEELNQKVSAAKKDADALAEKFNKRDFGTLSAAKPKVAEKLVNRGTAAVMRCLEIASGAPLTESELNATKASEINRECPSIANPNYVPVTP